MKTVKKVVPVAVTEAAYSGLILDQKRIMAERNELVNAGKTGEDVDRKNALIKAISSELDKLERILIKARKTA